MLREDSEETSSFSYIYRNLHISIEYFALFEMSVCGTFNLLAELQTVQ